VPEYVCKIKKALELDKHEEVEIQSFTERGMA